MSRLPLWEDLHSLRSHYTVLLKPMNGIESMLCALDMFVGANADIKTLDVIPLARRNSLPYLRLDHLNSLMHTPGRTLAQHKKSEPRVWPKLLPDNLFPKNTSEFDLFWGWE